MLAAFSFIELAYGFGILAIATFIPVYFLRARQRQTAAAEAQERGGAARDSAGAALQAVGIAVFIITAMNFTDVWRILWTPNGVFDLNKAVFPDLNGRWEGVLLSNGSLRNPGLDTSSTDTKADCSVFNLKNVESFACLRVAVQIDMSFFDTDIRLRLGSSESHTKSVWLKRRGRGRDAQIAYIYEVKQPGSVDADDRAFNGAAELTFLPGQNWVLVGGYWTDRNWSKANNTAGQIWLTKAAQ